MSEARDREIRALKDLLASPGWAVFAAAIREQWQGESFAGRMKLAVYGKREETEMSESCREVFAGRKAAEEAIAWVEGRIKLLEAKNAEELAQAVTPDIVRRA